MEEAKKKFYNAGYILILLLLIYAAGWTLSYILTIVLLIVAAIFLAYIILPMVRFFENPIIIGKTATLHFRKKTFTLWNIKNEIIIKRQGFKRFGAILVVYLIIFILIILLFSYIIPLMIQEVNNLIQNIPTLTVQLQARVDEIFRYLEPRLTENQMQYINQSIDRAIAQASQYIATLATYTITIIQRTLSALLALFLIPLFTFFILMDLENYKNAFQLLLPENRKEEINKYMREVDLVLGQYVRGQILVAIILGVATTIILLILRIEYAFIIGLIAGVFNFIPYLGTIVAILPAMIVALINHGFVWMIVTLVAMQAIQTVESQILTPTVMGEAVGLPPLVVILSLLIGAQVLGLLGVLIAVPIAAVIRASFILYLNSKAEKLRHENEEKQKIPEL